MEEKALNATYDAVMDVYGFRQQLAADGTTAEEKVLLASAVPCAVSAQGLTAAQGYDLPGTEDTVKIFCSQALNIEPGAELWVTVSGQTSIYRQVGRAKVYLAHQELLAKLTW